VFKRREREWTDSASRVKAIQYFQRFTEKCDHKKDDYDDCVEEREWKEKESGKRKRVGRERE